MIGDPAGSHAEARTAIRQAPEDALILLLMCALKECVEGNDVGSIEVIMDAGEIEMVVRNPVTLAGWAQEAAELPGHGARPGLHFGKARLRNNHALSVFGQQETKLKDGLVIDTSGNDPDESK